MRSNRHPGDYRRRRKIQSLEDLQAQNVELDRLMAAQAEERAACTCGGIYSSEQALSCPVHAESARRLRGGGPRGG